ncbi:glycosyltransferase [Arthrobacter sp. LAPM80]|uniref:glycosyltransferase n=1 Tax=Arthrobacter sp. LAPM80 TaxID=3141788 RepID=UPI00398B7EC2
MRVLVLATWFPDAAAPHQAPFNLSHVQAIAARHEVQVIHVRLGGRGKVVSEQYGGVTVTSVPFSPTKPWRYLAVARLLTRALRDADVLHTMAFSAAALATPVSAFARTPWVHTEHWSGMADPASVSKAWAAVAWLRYILKLPQAVTAVSQAQSRQLQVFARKGAVHVVPNVVQGQPPLAARSGRLDGGVRLVGVGGLIEGKRPELALDALGVLRGKGIDASLTWVGDGPLRNDLQAQAGRLGLGEHFSITGMVAPEEVTSQMRKTDVFILPSAHETFCMAAAEAVAQGVPAVVTDLPAVRDFLSAKNSVLVSGNAAADFADGVEQALEIFADVSPEEISATLGDNLGSSAVASKFSEIYESITASKRPRSSPAQGGVK